MTAARPFRSAVVAVLVLGSLAGCAEAPAPAPRSPVSEQLRSFLPEPVDAVGGDPAPAWTDLHRRLLAGEDPVQLAARIEADLGGDPDAPAGRLLLAETRLVAANPEGALAAIESLSPTVRGRRGVELLEARAREVSGELVRSHEIYRRWASASTTASDGAERTRAGAARALTDRIGAELDRGRAPEAGRSLDLLRTWDEDSIETSRAAAAVAAALGDAVSELEALRRLDRAGALAREGLLRRARLELDAGEPDIALRLYEKLTHESPEDVELANALDRARFRWRLSNAPREVQLAAREPLLTRADLARILYWLIPGVRAARGSDPKIASDIVGHPARDEVIRVVNLGLLRLNETMHRFDPDRPARRVEVLEAVLRASAPDGPGPSCAPGGSLAAGRSWEAICGAAASCGLIPETGECLPGAGVSGAEALDWIRRRPAGGTEP